MPCSQQKNGYDCGVYAIGNLVELAYGDPSKSKFIDGNLREHVINMFESKSLTRFPSEKLKAGRPIKPTIFFIDCVKYQC